MTFPATDWRRWLGGTALIVLLAIFGIDLGKFIATAVSAIGYPYDLDYGEGIVWQQMDDIVAGHGYARLGTFPAIVYHYPPVYHLVVTAVQALTKFDPLATGRLVSLLSTVTAMTMIAWLVRTMTGTTNRTSVAIGAIVGGIAFAISPTVIVWAPLMRVDMLATALTLGGLCFVIRDMRRPTRLPWAALCLTLAVYTKQTAVIAPIAAVVALWVVNRSAAWRFLIACGSMGVAALVVLMIATDGQFLRHVLSYNVNRFDPTRWQLLAFTLETQTINLAIAVTVIVGIVKRWWTSTGRDWATPGHGAALLIVVYFLLRILTLPLVLKSGASDNYLIDLFSAAAILVGVAATRVSAAILRGERWPRALLTMLVLIGLPVQAARLVEAHPAARSVTFRAQNAALVTRIAAQDKPVITDFMVLLRRAGRPVRFEPAIAAELAHSGLYDESGFVRMIRHGDFAFFLTSGSAGQFPFDERYNPAVSAAIAAAYPRTVNTGEMMILHLPTITPVPAPMR